MTDQIYRGALITREGVVWAPALPDESATVQRARTFEQSAPQVVEGESYTYVEAIPSKAVLRAAQLAHKIAGDDLGLGGVRLGFFGLASGRVDEKVVATAAYPLMGFTYAVSDCIWINVGLDVDGAAKAVAHEMKHRHILDAFPGITRESRERAACNYVERFWSAHSGAFDWARALGRQLGRE